MQDDIIYTTTSRNGNIMIIKGNFTKKSAVVASYDIETNNNVKFKVILKENELGFREFEIIISSEGSDDYSEVYSHPFYKDFVLPWTYKAKESSESPIKSSTPNNVIKFKNGNT